MKRIITIALLTLLVALFILELALGSIRIPFADVVSILSGNKNANEAWNTILFQSRLPRACAALLAGSALAIAGLLMQTLFRNPLAGPSVLGITSGSSLAVALLVMSTGGTASLIHGIGGNVTIAAAAFVGAFAVLFLILAVSNRIGDNVTLLIFGIMFGYFTGAIESILQFGSSKEALRTFVMWGMGTFSETDWNELIVLLICIVAAGILLVFVAGKLNLLLMGDDDASTLGVNVKRTRFIIIIITGLLAGSVTAFCGPIAFIGLAVPHLARMIFRTSEHIRLIPNVIIIGPACALLCDLVSRTPWTSGGLPLNAVTSLLGAPVVIYLIIRGSKSKALI